MQSLCVISACSSLHFLSTKVCMKEENPLPHQHKGPKLLKCWAPPLMAAVVTLSSPFSSPASTNINSGKGFLPKRQLLSGYSGFKSWVCSLFVAVIVWLFRIQILVALALLADAQRGAALFHKGCIGCHDGGGNILQPGATLLMKDLQRNGVDTEEAIYGITYYGKGRMPGFGENCTPRGQCTFGARLQDEEIKLLAEFVKSQADRGWPNIKSHGD